MIQDFQPDAQVNLVKLQHTLLHLLSGIKLKLRTEDGAMSVHASLGVETITFALPGGTSDNEKVLGFRVFEGLITHFFPDAAHQTKCNHPINGCMLEGSSAAEALSYKISSGYICQACVDNLLSSRSYSSQSITFLSILIDGLEGIRKALCQVSFRPKYSEYRLHVNRHGEVAVHLGKQIMPLSLGNGWEKALYFLLLQNPEGLKVGAIGEGDYREQLIRYYLQTKSWNYESCNRQIESWMEEGQFADLCSSNLTRIRTKLEKQLAKFPQLLTQLSINRGRGPKHILIDRNLVDFELPDRVILDQAA